MGDDEEWDPTVRARVALGAGALFMVLAGWFLITWPIGPEPAAPTLQELVRNCDDEAVRTHLAEQQKWSIDDRWVVVAVGCGTDMVRDALDAGASPDAARASDGWSALHEATAEGHLETVRLLIERGADPNVDSVRKAPLLIASFAGSAAMVKELLEAGALVDLEDTDGWTPLVASSANGSVEVVELLLDRGADIDHRIKAGDTALLRAAGSGNNMFVELLLRRGADPLIGSNDGHTPLFRAVAAGDPEVAGLLLEAGASPDEPGAVTYQQLGLSILRGGGILDLEAEFNHLVATLGGPLGLDPEVVEAGQGADAEQGIGDLDAMLFSGDHLGTFTPLYVAVVLDEVDIVRRLLDHGADPERGEIDTGHRPVDAARLLDRDAVVAMFEEWQ